MENSEISWTDSTFNPWWGCTKVAPGCDRCYAEQLDRRFRGGAHWGVGNAPMLMRDSYWMQPLKWHNKAVAANVRQKVFCGSMCDWADNNAPHDQRDRLWETIRQTHSLDYLLLTKRAPNIERFLPPDWGHGYPNVWLGVTVENRSHGLPRVEILRHIPAVVRFLSVEPLLEELGDLDLTGIDWVIVGGEYGHGARAMDLAWVTSIRCQCEEQGVSFFFKQHGGQRSHGGCLLEGIEVKEWPTPRLSQQHFDAVMR